MMKKLLFSIILFSGISFSIANAQVRLVRTTATATGSYTYNAAGDKISYLTNLAASDQSICGNVPYRVQLNTFTLNIKSTSIGRITIGGVSTGNGTRTLANITTSEGVVAGYTTSSTISSACGFIIINDISIPQNLNGTDITITLSGNVNMSEIILTSIETLPLKFLSFTAKPVGLGKAVNLNWKTSNEVNTKEFVVERRTDATAFSAIATVKSKNEDGIQNYVFVDQTATQGINYYRLKQIDKDGASVYIEIANAEIKGNLTLSVFPNPATEKLNVQHEPTTKSATIKIFSIDGKSLAETQVKKGSTTTDLSISALRKGQYVLVYNDGLSQNAIKFIKE